LPEIVVFPAVGHGLEIALPNGKESDIAAKDIVHANTPGTYRKAFPGLNRQRAQLIDAMADEYESGIGGIKFFVRLFDDEALHVHLPSEFV
jgi:hypothetical protein